MNPMKKSLKWGLFPILYFLDFYGTLEKYMDSEKDSTLIKDGPFLHFLEEKIRTKLSQSNADDLMRRLHLLKHWSWDVEIVPRHRRAYYDRITFAVLFAFLSSFSVGRTFAYLVTFNHIPNIFLNVKGVHVHHFIYGIIVLAIAGFLSLLSFSPKNKIWLALLYGCGLGLAADEAGQWLQLQDEYWVRQSYDAIIIISLVLLFIIYLPRYLQIFYKRFGVKRIEKSAPSESLAFVPKPETVLAGDAAQPHTRS